MSKIICHYCKKPGHMIADSRKRQNANSRRQSDTAHLAAPPETPTESETSQSPYVIGPLQHYFYDLRSTPTPDTDSFTPRQRKQIQRLNPSCHISNSSATGICSPLRLQHRGCLLSSGASKNMTGDSSLLSSLRSPSKSLIVQTANSEQFPLASLGTLSRYHRICSALFHLPALSVNLLSGLKKCLYSLLPVPPPPCLTN